MRRIAVLDAPSNLGLRPPTATSVPGCAKAPGALRDHGLLTRLGARDAGCLTPPRYDAGDWRPGDGVAHAPQIAAYSRALADRIGVILDAGEFPVILGGDCSILLGSGIAMNRLGEAIDGHIGLVFVDGHSDFRHPGNASYVGAAAGEDLALVTGRGQPDLAAIEGRRPYFRDVDVVVLGIRAQDEHRLDLQAAGIVNRPVPALRAEGAARSAQWAREQLADCAGYWVHIDVDVLDPAVMPAVDAPSPGGIAFPELELLLAGLVESPHCLGVEITVFDPDYDPDGEYAAEITSTVSAGLAAAHRVALRPDLAAARRDLDGPAESAAPSEPGTLRPGQSHPGEPGTLRPGQSHPGEAARLGPVARFGLAGPDDDQAENDESAREHRRAEAAADSVSLAAAGASGGASGTPEGPALPATTLLAVEEGAALPAERPVTDPPDATAWTDDPEPDEDSAEADRPENATDHQFEPSNEAPGDAPPGSLREASGERHGDSSDEARPESSGPAPDDAMGELAAEVPGEPFHEAGPGETAGESSDEDVVGPFDEPAGESSDEDVVGPFDEPAGESSDEAVVGPFDEPAGESSDEAVVGPFDEPAGESSDEAVVGPFDEPAGESSDEAVVGPFDEPADEDFGGPTGEAVFDGAPAAADEAEADSPADSAAGLPPGGSVPDGSVPGGSVPGDAGHHDSAEHEDDWANRNRSRLRPRNGAADPDFATQLLSRPLGSAPLLDSDPLPATRPGLLRPRRTDPDDGPRRTDPDDDAPTSEGFSLPVQRPAFDVGSGEPADIA